MISAHVGRVRLHYLRCSDFLSCKLIPWRFVCRCPPDMSWSSLSTYICKSPPALEGTECSVSFGLKSFCPNAAFVFKQQTALQQDLIATWNLRNIPCLVKACGFMLVKHISSHLSQSCVGGMFLMFPLEIRHSRGNVCIWNLPVDPSPESSPTLLLLTFS